MLAPPGQTESAKRFWDTTPLNEQVPSAGFTRSRERHRLPNDFPSRFIHRHLFCLHGFGLSRATIDICHRKARCVPHYVAAGKFLCTPGGRKTARHFNRPGPGADSPPTLAPTPQNIVRAARFASAMPSLVCSARGANTALPTRAELLASRVSEAWESASGEHITAAGRADQSMARATRF